MIGYVPYQLDDHWILSIKSIIPCSKSWFSKTHQKTQEALYLFGTPKGTVWPPKSFEKSTSSPHEKSRSSRPPKKGNRSPGCHHFSGFMLYFEGASCEFRIFFRSESRRLHPFFKCVFLKRAARFRGELFVLFCFVEGTF